MLVVLATVVVGCGGGTTESPKQRLVGEWLFVFARGERGTTISFKADGAYSLTQIDVPTPTSREEAVENGTYTATDSSIHVHADGMELPGPRSHRDFAVRLRRRRPSDHGTGWPHLLHGGHRASVKCYGHGRNGLLQRQRSLHPVAGRSSHELILITESARRTLGRARRGGLRCGFELGVPRS